MSTRSVIAEPYGDGFRGRYHHFDGYPSGVGHELWDLYHGHFAGDVDEMVCYLVTDEPQGWSNIIGADFSLPKGWHDSHARDNVCAVCGQPMWRHYAQYYPEGSASDPMVNGSHRAGLLLPNQVVQLGHDFHEIESPQGPQSYTARGETGPGYYIHSDGDDGGTEWAYVLCSRSLFIFERRYGMPHDDQGHGTGMFGLGASDTADGGYWAPVAEIAWNTDEPDWQALDQGSPLLTIA